MAVDMLAKKNAPGRTETLFQVERDKSYGRLFYVLPTALQQMINRLWITSVFFSEKCSNSIILFFVHAFVSRFGHSTLPSWHCDNTNSSNIVFSENRLTLFFSARSSISRRSVNSIIFWCTKNQMIRINIKRNISSMANVKSGRDWTIENKIRSDMSAEIASFSSKSTVSTVSWSGPHPRSAYRRRISGHITAKSFFHRSDWYDHTGNSITKLRGGELLCL